MSDTRAPKSRMARWSASAAGVVIAGLLVVLVLAEPGASESASSPLLGKPAPQVVSTTLEGEKFDLSRRKGSWVVLNFFNSTCVPCIREHPVLVEWEASQDSADDPVELYTIVNDDSDEAVRSFFAANGGDWPKVRDDDGTIAVAFGVAKVPETWVIDPAGFVRLRILGEIEEGFLEARLSDLRSPSGGGAP